MQPSTTALNVQSVANKHVLPQMEPTSCQLQDEKLHLPHEEQQFTNKTEIKTTPVLPLSTHPQSIPYSELKNPKALNSGTGHLHNAWKCKYQNKIYVLKANCSSSDAFSDLIGSSLAHFLAPEIRPRTLLVRDVEGQVDILEHIDGQRFHNTKPGSYHILSEFIPKMETLETELKAERHKRFNQSGCCSPLPAKPFFATPDELENFGAGVAVADTLHDCDLHLNNIGIVRVGKSAEHKTEGSKRVKLFDADNSYRPSRFSDKDYQFTFRDEAWSPYTMDFSPYNRLGYIKQRVRVRPEFPELMSLEMAVNPDYLKGRFSIRSLLPFFKVEVEVVDEKTGKKEQKNLARIFVEAILGTTPLVCEKDDKQSTWQDHFSELVFNACDETEKNMLFLDKYRKFLEADLDKIPDVMIKHLTDFKDLEGTPLINKLPANIKEAFQKRAEEIRKQLLQPTLVYDIVDTSSPSPPPAKIRFFCCSSGSNEKIKPKKILELKEINKTEAVKSNAAQYAPPPQNSI